MADQPRRRGVENTAQDEAAARRYRDDLLFEVGGAALRQRRKPGPLQLDPLAVVGIPPTDDFIDEAAVGIEIVEVTAAAQQQRVFERLLEMGRCELSIEPFSCATPGLLRVGVMP